MNFSDIPARIIKAFGINGLKNAIPTDSSTSTDNNGVATYDKGFPPITMQPLSAGGIPPSGKDMNGVLYSTTLKQQWSDAGMGYTFNNEFAAAIAGYPKGAIIPGSQLDVGWLSLIDGNGVNPETTSSMPSWVPAYSYGNTSISGLSNSNATLSPYQASKSRIILSGSLTANVSLTFPSWLKSWTVINNCSGNFSVVCRTSSGSGVSVQTGTTEKIIGDGVNIIRDFGTASQRNVGELSGNIPDMSFFPSLLSANGYQKLPGGLIIQWGFVNTGTAGVTISFPIPFSSQVFSVTGTDAGGSQANSVGISVNSLTGATIYGRVISSSALAPTSVRWMAIGI